LLELVEVECAVEADHDLRIVGEQRSRSADIIRPMRPRRTTWLGSMPGGHVGGKDWSLAVGERRRPARPRPRRRLVFVQ
jgi:hypothetical protein